MRNILLLQLILALFTIQAVAHPFMSEKEFQKMKEDEPNYKLEREKWMEDMHRAAPGTDWRKVDAQIREQKQQIRKEKIESLLSKNVKIENIQSDAVADGKLIGKWIERGSNNLAGRMMTSDIDWETGLLYNASSGGNIWRGTIDGDDWTCLNNGRRMGGISLLKVIRFDDTKRIFLFSGKRGFYTDNEGLTWESSKGLNKPNGIRRAVMTLDEKIIYFLGFEKDSANKSIECVYKSTDFGENFERIFTFYANNNMCDLWTSKYLISQVILLRNDTLSKINPDDSIEDLGQIQLELELSNFKKARLSGSVNKEGTTIFLWLQNKSNNYSHFFSTDDYAESWETLGIIDYRPFSINSFEASCINPEALYFGGVNCSRSLDGGKTWQLVNIWSEYYSNMENMLHADLPAITSFVNPQGEEVVIISTDGGSYISRNNLVNVKNISMYNLNVSQYYSTYTFREDPDIIFVGSQDQGFQRTTAVAENGTHSFEQTWSGDYAHLTSSDGGVSVWHVYPGFSMIYKNLAKPSITRQATLDFAKTGTGGLWLRPILADPKDPHVAYLAGGGTDGFHHIWKLNYNGSSIKAEEMPYRFDNKNVVSALGISNLNQDLFYAMTKNGNFFYSTNRGQDWDMSEDFSGLSGHNFYGASIAPSNIDANTVYIAGSGTSNPGAFVSYDYGQSFTAIDSGLPNTLVYRIALSEDDEFIFAATAVGPYVYIKDEGMWFDMADIHTPDQTYWTVEYIPSIRTARFGTYGRGIWDFIVEDANWIEEVTPMEPFNQAEEISLDTTLKWSISEKANYYHLQIATDLLFKNIFLDKESLSETEIQITELEPNKTYYWRVKAKKENYISSWSQVYSFNTIIVLPYSPALAYPIDNSTQVELLPVFNWESVPYATSYHLQVSKTDDFVKPYIDNEDISDNSHEDEFYLEEGLTYYWRVSSIIEDYVSEFSGYNTFTTVVPRPGVPELEYPTFGEGEITLNVTLVWSELENTEFYTINLASDNKFNNIVFEQDSINNHTYTFTDGLESYKLYHWRVRANNLSGYGEWSNRGMFVTGSHLGVESKENITNFIVNPNPFSQDVQFSFELGKASFISLKIYDLLGNEITTLMNEFKDAGSHRVKFEAGSLPHGIYYYIIRIGERIKRGRLVLLR